MDCPVCLEDNVIETNIHYMECMHFVCDYCYDKLLSNSCPLCRQEITLPLNRGKIFDELSNEDEMFFENDFAIPIMRKNRSEYKRNKFRKKKEQLEQIINQMSIFKNNSSLLNIPNKNKRFYNKTNRYISGISISGISSE